MSDYTELSYIVYMNPLLVKLSSSVKDYNKQLSIVKY